MAEIPRRLGRLAAVALLVAFATPPVVLLWLAAVDISVPSEFVMAAFLVPLGATTLGLGLLARLVAREADEPVLVDDRVAERLGTTSEEYEELLKR